MRERLVTTLLALGALALFIALFVPKPQDPAASTPLPVSTEGRDSGYQALWRWLESQRIPLLSFRERYGALEAGSLAPSGNLLVTTLPHAAPARDDEATRLAAWLQRGNTLLAMAALNDTPPWAATAAPPDFVTTLQRLTGLEFVPLREARPEDDDDAESVREALQRLIEPQRATMLPRGTHRLMQRVQTIATRSEYPASRWVLRDRPTLALELADHAADDDRLGDVQPAIWLLPHGRGQIIVIAFASPFSNALLGTADNAQLFANIVAHTRGAGGTVIFDDSHQGLVSYYDARAFFGDARLHRTLLWLGLLWLLFVLGWQRLRPRPEGWRPADVTAFIRLTGEFLAERIAPAHAAQRLLANFFNAIRQRLSLPQDGRPVWDWLAAQASLTDADLQELRRLHARAQAGRRIDLIALQNCLTSITGKLT